LKGIHTWRSLIQSDLINSDEPQQSEQEKMVKLYPEDDKIPDFSKYTKIEVSKLSRTCYILDQSDDSLENNQMDNSFDREDEPELDNQDISLKNEKRKPESANIASIHKIKGKDIQNNQHIQKYLESSMSINIMKPRDLEELKEDVSPTKAPEIESDLSLCESSNSLNLKFYESSKEKGNLQCDNLTVEKVESDKSPVITPKSKPDTKTKFTKKDTDDFRYV
jgi:hypothetical protein